VEKHSEKVTLDFGGLDIQYNIAGFTGFLETTGPHDIENVDQLSECGWWNTVWGRSQG
jgi:hypothetical protein